MPKSQQINKEHSIKAMDSISSTQVPADQKKAPPTTLPQDKNGPNIDYGNKLCTAQILNKHTSPAIASVSKSTTAKLENTKSALTTGTPKQVNKKATKRKIESALQQQPERLLLHHLTDGSNRNIDDVPETGIVCVNVPVFNDFDSLPTDENDSSDISFDNSGFVSLTQVQRSCPELNDNLFFHEEVEDLKKRLHMTETNLKAAHRVIDKYLTENAELKEQVLQYKAKIEKFNRICMPTSTTKTNSIRKKKTENSAMNKNKQNLIPHFASTPKNPSVATTTISPNQLLNQSSITNATEHPKIDKINYNDCTRQNKICI
ncbi:hypothetical protein O0L34_g17820 [Tuta absoluta]|nr:hypothetical protein O0L34_g17820 [Tuta absoluta]